MRIEKVFGVEMQVIRWIKGPIIGLCVYFFGLCSQRMSAQEGLIYDDPYAAFLWESTVRLEDAEPYTGPVESVLRAYEEQANEGISPGEHARVALKVHTASGAGLATPKALVSALADALERRGYQRKNIIIVDYDTSGLREAGYIGPLSVGSYVFDGMPVVALQDGGYEDPVWFYDNPLPPRRPRSFATSNILEDDSRREISEELFADASISGCGFLGKFTHSDRSSCNDGEWLVGECDAPWRQQC